MSAEFNGHRSSRTSIFCMIVWLSIFLSALIIFEPSPADILIILLFTVGIFTKHLSYNKQVIIPSLLLWLFLITNLLSTFKVYEAERATFFLLITFYLIMSWWFFVGFLTKYGVKAFNIIFNGYTIAAISSTILTIIAFFFAVPYRHLFLKYRRLKGLFKDPNVFGPFLIPVCLYAVDRASASRGWARLSWIIVFLISSIGVALSLSRAAWLNYMISFLFYLFIRLLTDKNTRLSRRLTGIIMIFLLLNGLLITVMSISNVRELFLERASYQSYDYHRFATQRQSIEQALREPFSLGIGPGQAEILFQYATHSLFVRILSENGFLGMIFFITFLILTIFRSLSLYLSNSSYHGINLIICASIVGISFNSFFIDSLHWRHFWLLLAMAWPNIEYKAQNVIKNSTNVLAMF